jgi:hypothetical protein
VYTVFGVLCDTHAAAAAVAAGALALGYANIFVTAPSPENLRTLFEFVFKGLDAAGYQEHIDYDLVESTNSEWGRAVVRVNVFRAHRQVWGGTVLVGLHKNVLVLVLPGFHNKSSARASSAGMGCHLMEQAQGVPSYLHMHWHLLCVYCPMYCPLLYRRLCSTSSRTMLPSAWARLSCW